MTFNEEGRQDCLLNSWLCAVVAENGGCPLKIRVEPRH